MQALFLHFFKGAGLISVVDVDEMWADVVGNGLVVLGFPEFGLSCRALEVVPAHTTNPHDNN